MDIVCVRCGTYEITAEALLELQNITREQRAILSGWIRENKNYTITQSHLSELLKFPMPSVGEKAEKILLQLGHKFPKPGEMLDLSGDAYLEFMAIGRVVDINELRFLMREYLHGEMDFLLLHELHTDLGVDETYKISPKGWAYIDSMKRGGLASDNTKNPVNAYVDSRRLDELRAIGDAKFDLSKLIQLCEELNRCFDSESYTSMIMLTRAIIDHVPPIFGYSSFPQVANNYDGGKSFRASMQHLENSSRNIADQHLHRQIRNSETIPNFTQVNFANDLDVLLAEVVRLLK